MLSSIQSISKIYKKKKTDLPPPTDNLVIHLKFGSSDRTGNNINNYGSLGVANLLGTALTKYISSTTTNKRGEIVSYCSLLNDATNYCYLKLPSGYTFSNNGSYTFSFYCNPQRPNGSTYMEFLNFNQSGYTNAFIIEAFNNILYVSSPVANKQVSNNSKSFQTANTWIHICVSYILGPSSTRVKVYIDGVLTNDNTNTTAQPSNLTSSAKYCLVASGDWGLNVLYYTGFLRNIRFYSRELSQAEITSCYMYD